MRNKRLYFGVLLCFILLIELQGCQKPTPIKIGFSACLSGVNSEVGVGARNAVELMVDQVNLVGGINGRQLELIVKDDENSLEKVAEVDRFFVEEGVMVIIGHDMSSKIATSLKIIKDKPILMVSPTISDYMVSGLDDNFLRIVPTNFDQGTALANYAKKQDAVIHVMAVVDSANQSFYEGVVKGFQETTGSKIDVVTIEKGITDDIERVRTAFRSSDYQGILMVLNSTDTAYLIQRLADYKKKTYFYSSNWAMTQDVIEQGGNAMDGVRFIAMIDLFSQNSVFLDFKRAYYERYKKDPNFSAVYAYETCQLIVAALQKTSKMSYTAIKSEMLALSPFESIQGTLNLDPYGDVKRESYIYTVEAGQFTKLK